MYDSRVQILAWKCIKAHVCEIVMVCLYLQWNNNTVIHLSEYTIIIVNINQRKVL